MTARLNVLFAVSGSPRKKLLVTKFVFTDFLEQGAIVIPAAVDGIPKSAAAARQKLQFQSVLLQIPLVPPSCAQAVNILRKLWHCDNWDGNRQQSNVVHHHQRSIHATNIVIWPRAEDHPSVVRPSVHLQSQLGPSAMMRRRQFCHIHRSIVSHRRGPNLESYFCVYYVPLNKSRNVSSIGPSIVSSFTATSIQ